MSDVAEMEVRRIGGEDEVRECARLMTNSEPWITLGRSYEECLRIVGDPSREVYVAARGGSPIGFIILNMQGAFVGYIQTVCVAHDWRGKGVGSALIKFAEERILRETPNVFMCVSSFNAEARRLYERLGYEFVGELRDYIVAGYSEILLRKTTGPLSGFKRKS